MSVVLSGSATMGPEQPSREPGPGLEWRAVVDEAWSTAAGDVTGMTCRRFQGHHTDHDGTPAVAVLFRTVYRRGRRGRTRYGYCAEHLYGRWIEGGKVCMWVVRRIGQP